MFVTESPAHKTWHVQASTVPWHFLQDKKRPKGKSMIKVLNKCLAKPPSIIVKMVCSKCRNPFSATLVWGGQSVIAAPTRNFRSSQSLHHNVTNKKTHQEKMKKRSIIPLITLTFRPFKSHWIWYSDKGMWPRHLRPPGHVVSTKARYEHPNPWFK